MFQLNFINPTPSQYNQHYYQQQQNNSFNNYFQQQQSFVNSGGQFRFYMFDSKTYAGSRDLIFSDSAQSFVGLDDKTTFMSFLPEVYRSKIIKLYECPLRLVRWCVISNFEKDKCRLMKNAFASRNIKPDLDCVSADSAWECMNMIKNRLADMITLDPADAYRYVECI